MRKLLLTVILLIGVTPLSLAQVVQTKTLISSGGVQSAAGTITMSSNLGDILVGNSTGGTTDVWHGFYTPIPLSLVGVNDPPRVTFFSYLGRSTPNPARAAAIIEFSNGVRQPVDLSLYDVAGRRVRQLRRGDLQAGTFRIPWDLRTDAGQSVPAGVYFARLTTRDFRGTRRMVVIR